jgi:lactoylglutathione lyase
MNAVTSGGLIGPARLLHAMIRVRDHDKVIELTHNWRDHDYALGSGFGHIALGVSDVYAAANALSVAGVKILRPPGPLKGAPTETIAFLEDPDGYRIELVGKP